MVLHSHNGPNSLKVTFCTCTCLSFHAYGYHNNCRCGVCLFNPRPYILTNDRGLGFYSLFDMDGTLVDSTEGVVGAWETFAQRYVGLDVRTVLGSKHTYPYQSPIHLFGRSQPLTVFERWKTCVNFVE
jgi:hypothetical protein